MRIALLVLLFAAVPALAQGPIPDTTAAWRYFPLQIGNVWEYEYSYYVDVIFRMEYLRVEVEADSVIGDARYQVLRNDGFEADGQPQPGGPIRQLVRFDTTAAMVVMRTASGEKPWEPVTPLLSTGVFVQLQPQPCRYDADFEGPVACTQSVGWVSGGYDLPTGLGGFHTAIKYFDPASLIGQRYALAADLGPLEDHVQEGSETHRVLRYARINGAEHGSPLPLVAEPSVPAAGLALAAHPNPFTTRVTLTLSVRNSQWISVEVFDGLGRRIHAEAREVLGSTWFPLDGDAWAPGVYVVRVTAPDGTQATARIVRQ